MISYLNQKKAQTTMEYAILAIVVIGALVAMKTYMDRGIAGRLKGATDEISENQFSPDNTNSVMATRSSTSQRQTYGIEGQGVQKTTLLANEKTEEVSRSVIINTQRGN